MKKNTTKIQLGKVVKLQKELSQLLSEKISFGVKWEIRNILNSFKNEAENFNEIIAEIYKKYGKEDAATGGYKIDPKNIEEATAEMKQLTTKEIEVVGKLPIKDLEAIKSENEYFEVFLLVEK